MVSANPPETLWIEGVEYERFTVHLRIRTRDRGLRRLRWHRWSPRGGVFVRSEIAREVDDRFGHAIVPGSDVIVRIS